jgi:chromate transporter
MADTDAAAEPPHVSLAAVAGVFLRLGITSFGGGTAAWVHRELVDRRRWLSEDAFLTGLTVAQILPGANPVNLALYFGLELRGSAGAAAAALGLLAPSFAFILVLGALYNRFAGATWLHAILTGLAAVGIAVTISVGLKVAKRLRGDLAAAAIAAAVFAAVGLLHWPMAPVVIVAAPLSIALASRKLRASS